MKLKTFVLYIPMALLALTGSAFAATDADTLGCYLSIQKALAGDDLNAVKAEANAWAEHAQGESSEGKLIASIADAENIGQAREAFLALSNLMIAEVNKGEVEHSQSLYLAHCPMAFQHKGGSWIQSEKTVNNPYFGGKMLHCGTIKAL